MIPQRRFATLLDQARVYQQSRCLYHNSPTNARTFSLYADHLCDQSSFPKATSAILEGHSDEVWNLAWSHDGRYLATASSDKIAIIWRIGVSVVFSVDFQTRPWVFRVLYIDCEPSSLEVIPVHETSTHIAFCGITHILLVALHGRRMTRYY